MRKARRDVVGNQYRLTCTRIGKLDHIHIRLAADALALRLPAGQCGHRAFAAVAVGRENDFPNIMVNRQD